MRKFTLLLAGIFILAISGFSQSDLIVGWTFPNNALAADTGISANLGNLLVTLGGTSEIELKNGYATKAAQASGWDLGMGEKAWMVLFSTSDYSNITVSSRQQSGGNDPGPKDFQIEYSIDFGVTWVPVPGGEITVENDWETSYVDNLSLPNVCNNQLIVEVRWVMTTNVASGAGGAVQETGKSKIDNIFIRGDKINGIDDLSYGHLKIGPNPVSDFLSVQSEQNISRIRVIDISGKAVINEKVDSRNVKLDTALLPSGVYIVSVETDPGLKPYRQRILKID